MKKTCIFESSYHIIIISQVFVVKLQAFLLGPILESKGMLAIFQKKGKKGQNIWKFGQKCTTFDNILKKGSLMRATIACMKLLEHTLFIDIFCLNQGQFR